MSQWDDRFRNHTLHNTLSEIFQKLNEAEPEIEDSKIAEAFSRLYSVMKYVKSELETADPELVSAGVLEHIGGHLTTMNARLKNFLENRQIKPLINSNSDADLILDSLPRLGGMRKPFDLEGIGEDLSAFRQRMGRVVQKLEKHVSSFMDEAEKQQEEIKKELKDTSGRVDQVANRLNDLDSSISAKGDHLDSIISTFRNNFSEAQSNRQAEYDQKSREREEIFFGFQQKIEEKMGEVFDERKTNADKLFAKYDKQVKDRLTSLDQEVKTRVDSLETNAKKLLDDLKEKEVVFFEEQKIDAKAQIGILKTQVDKAKELVNLVSDITITGNYANVASQERKKADLLRWIALGLMGAMVVLAFYTVYLFVGQPEFEWKIAFFRIVSIGIVAIPAFYVVRESDIHRRNERRNRKFQLELTAIDPYLKTMPQSEQDKLKVTLAERFFAQPEPVTEKEDTVKAKTVFGLLETLLKELLGKVK